MNSKSSAGTNSSSRFNFITDITGSDGLSISRCSDCQCVKRVAFVGYNYFLERKIYRCADCFISMALKQNSKPIESDGIKNTSQ